MLYCYKRNLETNIRKRKALIVSSKNELNIDIKQMGIERAIAFDYLGSIINNDKMINHVNTKCE